MSLYFQFCIYVKHPSKHNNHQCYVKAIFLKKKKGKGFQSMLNLE